MPVVNENDTVSVEQFHFGDNDTLGAIVSVLVGADLYVILSDIDGLYDGDPATHPDARLIERVERHHARDRRMAGGPAPAWARAAW